MSQPAPLAALTYEGEARGALLDRTHECLGRIWSEAPGVASLDRVAFVTAVAEVVGNVVGHAPAPHVTVTVELTAWTDRLQALVTDDGPAVDLPDSPALPDVMAESGRGLHLATSLADVRYRRSGDRNHWAVIRVRSDRNR